MSEAVALDLGPEVVALLVRQRRPFAMLDRVTAWEPGGAVEGAKFLSLNEAMFDGHFPEWALMPAAMTFEALGQTCGALAALTRIEELYREGGRALGELLFDLRNAELGATARPGFDAARHAELVRAVARASAGRIGVAGATEMKFVEPVFAGARLDLRAAFGRRVDASSHYAVQAAVDGRVVARGTITVATIVRP